MTSHATADHEPAALTGRLAAVAPQVVAWRRHLHRHPELSFAEHRTAAYVEAELGRVGIATARPTATSVVGRIRGGRPGRTVAVRADIDALPIEEDTGLPFASTVPGVMHACGHDGHTAALLGVAHVLAGLPAEERAGEVVLVFQHGEEQFPKGAPQLIEAGVLDGVDAIVGQHLMTSLPAGTVGVSRHALMASSDGFAVRFAGRGGHGGMPHEAIDPIPALGDLVQGAQRLVAREFGPHDPVVLSVTEVHAGDAYNVIPSVARAAGTLRALDEGDRDRLWTRLRELVRDVAALHRLDATCERQEGPPVLVNDPAVVDTMAACAAAGGAAVREIDPVMAGDDYAHYLHHVPGAYAFVGAAPEAGAVHPHHHPRFDIAESALPVATGLLVRSALALACD